MATMGLDVRLIEASMESMLAPRRAIRTRLVCSPYWR